MWEKSIANQRNDWRREEGLSIFKKKKRNQRDHFILPHSNTTKCASITGLNPIDENLSNNFINIYISTVTLLFENSADCNLELILFSY